MTQVQQCGVTIKQKLTALPDESQRQADQPFSRIGKNTIEVELVMITDAGRKAIGD
jgi:hypothetical protein